MNKWLSVEKDGYPKDDNDYLLSDGEDYFIGYWRPETKAWDNCNSGWVRKYSDDYQLPPTDDRLANIKWYMQLPEQPINEAMIQDLSTFIDNYFGWNDND